MKNLLQSILNIKHKILKYNKFNIKLVKVKRTALFFIFSWSFNFNLS